MAQLAIGAPPKKRKVKNVLVNDTLQRLANNTFDNAVMPSLNNVLQYLDAAAHQLWDVKH